MGSHARGVSREWLGMRTCIFGIVDYKAVLRLDSDSTYGGGCLSGERAKFYLLLLQHIQPVCSYVEQSDVIIATLTVRETLHYAAELRLPAKLISSSVKKARVEEIIAQLGLGACIDTLIGMGTLPIFGAVIDVTNV